MSGHADSPSDGDGAKGKPKAKPPRKKPKGSKAKDSSTAKDTATKGPGDDTSRTSGRKPSKRDRDEGSPESGPAKKQLKQGEAAVLCKCRVKFCGATFRDPVTYNRHRMVVHGLPCMPSLKPLMELEEAKDTTKATGKSAKTKPKPKTSKDKGKSAEPTEEKSKAAEPTKPKSKKGQKPTKAKSEAEAEKASADKAKTKDRPQSAPESQARGRSDLPGPWFCIGCGRQYKWTRGVRDHQSKTRGFCNGYKGYSRTPPPSQAEIDQELRTINQWLDEVRLTELEEGRGQAEEKSKEAEPVVATVDQPVVAVSNLFDVLDISEEQEKPSTSKDDSEEEMEASTSLPATELSTDDWADRVEAEAAKATEESSTESASVQPTKEAEEAGGKTGIWKLKIPKKQSGSKKKGKKGSSKQMNLGSAAFGDSEKTYAEECEQARDRTSVPSGQRPLTGEGKSADKPKPPPAQGSAPDSGVTPKEKVKPKATTEASGSKGHSVAVPKDSTSKTAQPKDKPSESAEDISRRGVLPSGSSATPGGWQMVKGGKVYSLDETPESVQRHAMERWRRGAQKEFQRVEAEETRRARQQAKNRRKKHRARAKKLSTTETSGSEAPKAGGTPRPTGKPVGKSAPADQPKGDSAKPKEPTAGSEPATPAVPAQTPQNFPALPEKLGEHQAPAPMHQGVTLPVPRTDYRAEEIPAGSLVCVFTDGQPRWLELAQAQLSAVRPTDQVRLRRVHGTLDHFCPVQDLAVVPTTPETTVNRYTGLPSTVGRRDAGGNVSLGIRRAQSVQARLASRQTAIPSVVAVFTETFVPRAVMSGLSTGDRSNLRLEHPTIIVDPPAAQGGSPQGRVHLRMQQGHPSYSEPVPVRDTWVGGTDPLPQFLWGMIPPPPPTKGHHVPIDRTEQEPLSDAPPMREEVPMETKPTEEPSTSGPAPGGLSFGYDAQLDPTQCTSPLQSSADSSATSLGLTASDLERIAQETLEVLSQDLQNGAKARSCRLPSSLSTLPSAPGAEQPEAGDSTMTTDEASSELSLDSQGIPVVHLSTDLTSSEDGEAGKVEDVAPRRSSTSSVGSGASNVTVIRRSLGDGDSPDPGDQAGDAS